MARQRLPLTYEGEIIGEAEVETTETTVDIVAEVTSRAMDDHLSAMSVGGVSIRFVGPTRPVCPPGASDAP